MATPIPDGPDLFIEIAPGDTPLTVSPTWVDVTDKVAWSLLCERGAFSRTERVGAGRMRVTFDDPERDLDSTNTSSPHAPYIRPRLPVRFRASYDSIDYALWRGHLSTPSHSYAPEGDDTSLFDCDDLLSVMARADTSQRSAWAMLVESLSPLGWWRFGDQSPVAGAVVTDDVGSFHGRYHGTSTSVDGLVDAEQSTAVNLGTTGWAGIDPSVGTSGGDAHTMVFRFSCPATTSGSQTLISQPPTRLGPGIASAGFRQTHRHYQIVILGTDAGADAGKLRFSRGFDASSFPDPITTSGTVTDDQAHTVAVVFEDGVHRLYFDGVLVDEDNGPTVGPSPYDSASHIDLYVGVYDGLTELHADNTVVDELALLGMAIDADDAESLHDAAVDSLAGDTTGQRIARAAALAMIPDGLVDLDDGISTVVAWAGGPSTLEVAKGAVETEQGLLTVAGDGTLTFRDRHHFLNASPVATFGDTGSDLTYAEMSVEEGEALIVNRATFTSEVGSGFAEDLTSQAVYGVFAERRTTIDDSQANLVAGAQYLVARRASPALRIVGLVIDPSFDPATLWPEVLGREIGDRIAVNRTPDEGTAISQTLTITGVRHSITREGWRTAWALTDADTAAFAISDVDTSDGPALAAY